MSDITCHRWHWPLFLFEIDFFIFTITYALLIKFVIWSKNKIFVSFLKYYIFLWKKNKEFGQIIYVFPCFKRLNHDSQLIGLCEGRFINAIYNNNTLKSWKSHSYWKTMYENVKKPIFILMPNLYINWHNFLL